MGAGPRPASSALEISATALACSPMHWYMCARSATSRACAAPQRVTSAPARWNAASASAGRASCRARAPRSVHGIWRAAVCARAGPQLAPLLRSSSAVRPGLTWPRAICHALEGTHGTAFTIRVPPVQAWHA